MSLKTIQCSVVVCDGCGEEFDPGGEVLHFRAGDTEPGSEPDIWLSESDWKTLGTQHFCPDSVKGCEDCEGDGCVNCGERGWAPILPEPAEVGA